MQFSTIPEMFIKICNKFGSDKTAFMLKKNGDYVNVTYEEVRDKVECFAVGLLELGIHSGDRVGIVSENRLEWAIADFAITGIGAVDVPVFPTLAAKQEEYIYNDCEAVAIVVSNNFQLKKILEVKDTIPSLRHVIVMNDDVTSSEIYVKLMSNVIRRGSELRTKEERRNLFEEMALKASPEDLLTLIYTSGTTGNPKGVMLTNKNIVANLIGVKDAIPFDDTDVFLSFLPMCHSYERTAGYYTPICVGATIAFAEAIESVGTNITEVRPTLMTTVPRLLELIRKRIYQNIEKESGIKQRIFHWAVKTGLDYLHSQQEGKNPLGLKSMYLIADKLVFSKIRARTGGRLRLFASGGAALPVDVCEFFLATGITIIEGYGLTESSPVLSVTRHGKIEVGTVGIPLMNVEIKIAEDGEILAKGDNIMKGYWNDPLATNEAIDEDGWLYTGDIGKLTEKGNLKITDRKKSIIVSSGGKNIAPQPIENILSQSPYIEHCVLIGDKRDYITALLTPDFDQLKKLADTFGIKYDSQSELIGNGKIIQTIKNDIDRLQNDFAKYERVRKFKLLSQPFTVENGELTPKLSIKRHVVERKFHYLIEEMYKID
ncbi:MAG: long-chain fatty acid--CoA ligase [Ignavibacteriae bacterium]|nr:long-chain fatty acid--CoA ligase [Ignavibacteriota bacterium]